MTRPGPKIGYRQTPEHIAKRIRRGPESASWRGREASWTAAHKRAIRAYPAESCSRCGRKPALRHHVDNDPWNNEASNIEVLCYSCHAKAHGRIGIVPTNAKLNEDDVREIRARAEAGETPTELARAFDVTWGNVRLIVRRLTWRHVA